MRTGGQITDNLISTYEHPRIRLVIGSKTISEDYLADFSYRTGTSDGGAFSVGGCVVSSVNFVLRDYDNALSGVTLAEGTQVTVYVGYGTSDGTAKYDQLGIFYIASCPRTRRAISVQAYDKLRQGDKVKFSGTFPMTVQQVITKAASDMGITVQTYPPAGGNIRVDIEETPDITARQALQYALQCCGAYCRVRYDGKLVCGWYSFSSAKTVSYDDIFGESFSPAASYTGVQVDGSAIKGTTNYLYVLSGNPFITDTNRITIRDRLYTALVGKTFYSGSATILADPRIEPGDCLTLPFYEGDSTSAKSILMPVTSIVIKGSMGEDISCESVTQDEAQDLRETTEAGAALESEVKEVRETATEALDKANSLYAATVAIIQASESTDYDGLLEGHTEDIVIIIDPGYASA